MGEQSGQRDIHKIQSDHSLGGPKWTPEQAARAALHAVSGRTREGAIREEDQRALSNHVREWMRVRVEALQNPDISPEDRERIEEEAREMHRLNAEYNGELQELVRARGGRKESLSKEVQKKIQEYTEEISKLVENFFNELEAAVYDKLRSAFRQRITNGVLTYRKQAQNAESATEREEAMRTAARFVQKNKVPFSDGETIAKINRFSSMIQFMRRTGNVMEDPEVVRQREFKRTGQTVEALLADLERDMASKT